MALTGNTVASTYLDLVQLEQSGAGLPSHAGKEAALYDGSGAQIVGRSAVRHWLDPHPDAAAFAETWEFSTTGDMTQGQLETAGWTFVGNSQGSVSNGVLTLVNSSGYGERTATLAVSLTGDFDIVCSVCGVQAYDAEIPQAYTLGGFGVMDTVNNVTHCIIQKVLSTGGGAATAYINGQTTNLDAGSSAVFTNYTAPLILRMSRVSGTVYLSAGSPELAYMAQGQTAFTNGWASTSVADADTYDVFFIALGAVAVSAGSKANFRFIRRFQ